MEPSWFQNRIRNRSQLRKAIFEKNIACSGVIPQISAIYGPAAGGAT